MNKKTKISLIAGIIAVILAVAAITLWGIFSKPSAEPESAPVSGQPADPDEIIPGGQTAQAPQSGQTANENTPPSASDDFSDNEDTAGESVITKEKADEIINKIAKEKFGADPFVLFLSTEGPSEVEIEGIKRNVYIYAADSVSGRKDSGKIRGLYHLDIRTGEVFDNGSGTMKKIIYGE